MAVDKPTTLETINDLLNWTVADPPKKPDEVLARA